MALKSELMAMGMPASLAKRIGFDAAVNFAAAGSGQTTATVLTSNHAIVNSGSGGVIMGDAEQMFYVQNALGGNLTVYPPVGGTFTGQSQNAGLTVPTTKSLWIEPAGIGSITWSVSA